MKCEACGVDSAKLKEKLREHQRMLEHMESVAGSYLHKIDELDAKLAQARRETAEACIDEYEKWRDCFNKDHMDQVSADLRAHFGSEK